MAPPRSAHRVSISLIAPVDEFTPISSVDEGSMTVLRYSLGQVAPDG